MPKEKLFDEAEVLQKAMLIFWEKGYSATSVEELVKGMGISRSSLYDTFKGKKELFERVFDTYRYFHEEGLENFMEKQEDVLVGLKLIFQKVIAEDSSADSCKGCFVVNTATELLPAPSTSYENQAILQHKEKMEDLFLNFLHKGVEKGQITDGKDFAAISRLLFTLMMGLRVVGKMKQDPEKAIASVEAVLSLLTD
ncbi:MAG: TetR/AcrR family transcriptional regulator [Bacteroidota bacterium]